jgi:AcrR family transcriptional regulator
MAVTDARLEWVRPPRQARSQQTLERLLDAAETLIEEGGLESATVAEIARRGGSSVGAFYARFTDKEGLLRCVFERFHEQAAATAEAVLAPERWREAELADALETMVLFMLRVARERRGLIRALLVRAAGDPSLSAFGRKLHEHITRHMLALVRHRDVALEHPAPETGVRMAVLLVLAAIEMRTLYGESGVEHLPDGVIAAECARMCVRFLGVRSALVPAATRRGIGRARAPGHPRRSWRRARSGARRPKE